MALSSSTPGGFSVAGGGVADLQTEGLYPISVVTEMTGLGANTLRGYERAGLLRPTRTAGGMRLYSPRDVTIVRRAAALAAEGVNVTGIRRILQLEAEVASLRAGSDGMRQAIATAPAQPIAVIRRCITFARPARRSERRAPRSCP